MQQKTHPSAPLPELVTAPELRAALKCSTWTLNAWEKAGKIPAPIRIGSRRLWRRADLLALLGVAA